MSTTNHYGLISLTKNLLLNVKEVGFKNISLNLMFKYPRLRLYAALPGILFTSSPPEQYVYKCLGIKANSGPDETVTKFIKLWKKFN